MKTYRAFDLQVWAVNIRGCDVNCSRLPAKTKYTHWNRSEHIIRYDRIISLDNDLIRYKNKHNKIIIVKTRVMTRASTGAFSWKWVEWISTKTNNLVTMLLKIIVKIMHEQFRLNFVRLDKMFKIFRNYPWPTVIWNSFSHELKRMHLII